MLQLWFLLSDAEKLWQMETTKLLVQDYGSKPCLTGFAVSCHKGQIKWTECSVRLWGRGKEYTEETEKNESNAVRWKVWVGDRCLQRLCGCSHRYLQHISFCDWHTSRYLISFSRQLFARRTQLITVKFGGNWDTHWEWKAL